MRLIFRVFRALRSSFSHLSATNPANLVEETDNPAHESSRPPRYPISVNPLSPNLTKRLAIALAFCCLAAVSGHAAPSPIKIDLVSEARAIVPGETFTAAIRQRMKPGYHTYWRNPGTVGLATSMKWRLPKGFSAGEIQWQLPELTTMAAYTVWGYEKEALLLVDITPPKSLTTGDKVVLRGEAAWMCCGKQCHPGFQELSLTLPVANKAKTNKRLKRAFDRVRAQQPIHSDAWKIECTTTGEDYTLRITPASKKANTNPGAIRFFDYNRQISSDKPQILKRDGDSFILKLKAEEHTPDELETLEGILVAENGWSAASRNIALLVATSIKRNSVDARLNALTPEEIPASSIDWRDHFGISQNAPKTILTLLARGYFQAPTINVESVTKEWLSSHPNARAVIVSAWGPTNEKDPDSRTAYIWIIDGDESLNTELVRQGCCPYQTQILSGSQKLSISDKEYQNFVARLQEAGVAAREAKRGIWNKP